MCKCVCVCVCVCAHVCVCVLDWLLCALLRVGQRWWEGVVGFWEETWGTGIEPRAIPLGYGVTMISRFLIILGLFCKI